MGRRLSTRFFCVLLFLVAGATRVARAQTSPSQDERKLFHLLNQERQKAGLPKLQWDNHLAKSAGGHALLLAEHQGLSHQFSGEPQLAERIGATGLRFTVSAENVASAQTVEDAHKGLMNSPPHRANILSPEFNAVGLAVIPRAGAVYVAQNFVYVLPVYSEAQFRRALLEAFRNARQEKGVSSISWRPDTQLHHAACSDNPDARKLLRKLNGATDLLVFTSSKPEKLPSVMQKTAANPALRRGSVEVCFKPGPVPGYGSFQVVAAFYSGPGRA